MSLHGRFNDEAEFRDKFVKPLLNRLGFYGVEEQHGRQEFGKDFVFSELHRLGGMRHYAAQVKYEEKINQGAKVDELLSQIRQAFAVTFKRGDSPRDCHISSVYVFNSGEVTDNARTYIAGELVKANYGDNVHFLDGERLEALDQWATYESDRNLRTRLLSLRQQLAINHSIFEALAKFEWPKAEVLANFEFFLHGMEAYLASPMMDEKPLYATMYTTWNFATILNRYRKTVNTPFGLTPENRKTLADSIRELAAEAVKVSNRSRTEVERYLQQLNALK